MRCYLVQAQKRPAIIAAKCDNCEKEFHRTTAALTRYTHQFCGRVCAREFLRGENHAGWRGDHDPNRGPEWQKIAEEVRARDGHRCRVCGKTQEQNGQKLSVDHVIPWRAFEDKREANDKRNLVSTCRSCHSRKTHRTERLWLKGDMIDFMRYAETVRLKEEAG